MRKRALGFLCATFLAPVPARALVWTRVEELPADDIETVQLHGTTLFATAADRLYRGANNGTTWSASNPVGVAGTPLVTVIPAGNALWVGSFGQGVRRSTDDGSTWNALNNGFSGLGAAQIMEFAAKGGTLYAGTAGAGVFAIDLATQTTWVPFNDGLPVFTAGTVQGLVLHGTTLVAQAGPNGLIYRVPQGATAWEEVPLQPPLLPGFIATDVHTDGTNLLVVNGSRVYHSIDDAQTWTLTGAGLVNGTDVHLAHAGSTFFAVVDFINNTHQFFASTDAGASWHAIEDVQDVYVYAIETAGDNLFAARTDGLWWTPLATTGVRPASWAEMKARFRH
jgi:photosystem II stability/assembly factor-like uncharacterized protein